MGLNLDRLYFCSDPPSFFSPVEGGGVGCALGGVSVGGTVYDRRGIVVGWNRRVVRSCRAMRALRSIPVIWAVALDPAIVAKSKSRGWMR